MTTTLILGAGVSLKYGYPSGPELIARIEKKLLANPSFNAQEIHSKLKTFRPESIDEFIEHFPDSASFVKQVIAEVLFECEDPTKDLPLEEDFYHLLCRKIPRNKYENFKIITFNYDRRLEYAFLNFLQTFNGTVEKAANELRLLEIVHVHGRLPAMPGEDDFKLTNERQQYPYGFGKSGYGVKNENSVSVLRTALKPGSTHEERQRLLLNAEREATIDRRKQNIRNFGSRSFRFVHEGSLLERAKKYWKNLVVYVLRDSDTILRI